MKTLKHGLSTHLKDDTKPLIYANGICKECVRLIVRRLNIHFWDKANLCSRCIVLWSWISTFLVGIMPILIITSIG